MLDESGAVAMDPLTVRVPLQPPEAAQLWAPLALQVSVTACPEATVLGLNSSEIEGLTAAAAAVPPPDELTASCSQAASVETTAQANNHRERRRINGRAGAVRPQSEGARTGETRIVCPDRRLRPAKVIPRLPGCCSSVAAVSYQPSATCHNEAQPS